MLRFVIACWYLNLCCATENSPSDLKKKKRAETAPAMAIQAVLFIMWYPLVSKLCILDSERTEQDMVTAIYVQYPCCYLASITITSDKKKKSVSLSLSLIFPPIFLPSSFFLLYLTSVLSGLQPHMSAHMASSSHVARGHCTQGRCNIDVGWQAQVTWQSIWTTNTVEDAIHKWHKWHKPL